MNNVTDTEQQIDADKLAASMKSGANWFYWIAGLSLVNTALHLFDSERSFIVGLGITQIVDVIAMEIGRQSEDVGTVVKAIAFGIGLAAAALFVAFGVLANKRKGWAFVIGMTLYLLDGGIFLLVQDWLSLAFHAFALLAIFAGYSAMKKLKTLENAAPYEPIAPKGVL
jgi:hypothetical protein